MRISEFCFDPSIYMVTMVTLTLTKDQFNELYDAVKDLPDIYKSEALAGEYELDNAHYDLFDAVKAMDKIALGDSK